MAMQSRLERILMRIYFYYMILLGISSSSYNFYRYKYETSCWIRFQAYFANLFTLVSLPWSLYYGLNHFSAIRLVHPLVEISMKVAFCINVCVIAYTTVTRARRERNMEYLAKSWFRLERKNLLLRDQNSENAEIETEFQRLFYMQYGINTFLMTNFFLAYTFLPYNYDGMEVFGFLALFSNAQNIVHCAVFIFVFILFWALRAFSYINLQFYELFEIASSAEILEQQKLNWICLELWRLQRVHWKYTKFIRELVIIYRYQLMATRLYFNTTLSAMGYILVILSFDHNKHVAYVFIMAGNYFCMLLQLLFIGAICEKIVNAAAESSFIIRRFSELHRIPRQLRQRLDEVTLEFNSRKLEINMFGLYSLNKRLWFVNFNSLVLNTIFLLQYHLTISGKIKEIIKNS